MGDETTTVDAAMCPVGGCIGSCRMESRLSSVETRLGSIERQPDRATKLFMELQAENRAHQRRLEAAVDSLAKELRVLTAMLTAADVIEGPTDES